MTFILRHPGYTDQFCTHDDSLSTTVAAGAVVYLSGTDAATGRALVTTVTGVSQRPYGFLMQKVKAVSAEVPTGYRWPGDLGSSDAYTGDPVGVAHLGIASTTHYTLDTGKTVFAAGEVLYANVSLDTGKVQNGTTLANADNGDGSTPMPVAEVVVGLPAAQITAGSPLLIKLLI